MYVHLPIYVQERFARASRNGAYGAAVETIDWVTAVILHELRTRGLDESTIVVFTSDNGSRGRDGGSNAPLRGTKGTTWEGGMRVPCIVRWPGRVAPGRTSDELVTSIDLFPTLAALCGAELPGDRTIDGVDIVGAAARRPTPSPRETFCYYWMNDLEAVRAGPLEAARRQGRHAGHASSTTSSPTRPSRPTAPRSYPTWSPGSTAIADEARRSLGDARLGVAGADVRPIGRVADPAPAHDLRPGPPLLRRPSTTCPTAAEVSVRT